jgi:hypothetical protein
VSLPSGIPSTLVTIASTTNLAANSSLPVTSPPSSSPTSVPSSTTTQQSPPPPTLTSPKCRGLDNTQWVARDFMKDGIKDFCINATATNQHDPGTGSFFYRYSPNVKENTTNFWVDWPQGVSIADQIGECITSLNSVMDSKCPDSSARLIEF